MNEAVSEFLQALRESQDGVRKSDVIGYVPFGEWNKANGRGTARGGINPAVGMMGHLNTSSYAPAGPYNRPSGERGVGWNGRTPNNNPSKYANDRPSQPLPYIEDVDMDSVWYSPMEPVHPFGPPYYNRPREWNYPVGYNINFIPKRLELMGMLRGMRESWGVLSTVIQTRKDQLMRLPWTIQQRDKPRAKNAGVEEARKFFRRPDGKLSYNQWSRKLLDDLFVIDAPSVYLDRNLGGRLRHAEVLDGGTIFPLIDDAGRRPDSIVDVDASGVSYERRQPAYQQIIYGLPMVNLSEDELMYPILNPRPELPMFGYSPVQQMLSEITEAIRKTFYQLEFWRSGSMPELIVTVPDTWTPRQIAMFQGHFDALLSGQLTLKSKVRFVPGGMKPFDIKNASGESLWSERDELLVRLCCYAFSVSPTPFVKQTNRATAQNATQTAQEEGLYPLMSWWKDDIMDTIIQEQLGFDDVEFMFLPRPEVDLLKQAQIHQIKLHSGEMTLDEARAENGEEPYAEGLGAVPLVYFGAGAVPVEHVIDGSAALPGAPPGPASTNAAPQRPVAQNQAVRGPARARNQVTNRPQPRPSPTAIHKIDASDISDAADDARRHPTKAQKKFGNYRKGHIRLHGLDISIENAKGSMRGEKDGLGREWQVKMPTAYGYIRGTIGADGDQVDVYLGKHPKQDTVYVIDQDKFVDGVDHGFDEHKVMLGYKSLKRAVKDYVKSHFDDSGHERAAAVTRMSVAELKQWLRSGDMSKPISEQGVGAVVARRGVDGGLAKTDTISSATGLSWYDQTTAAPRKRKRKKKRDRRGPRWLQLNA